MLYNTSVFIRKQNKTKQNLCIAHKLTCTYSSWAMKTVQRSQFFLSPEQIYLGRRLEKHSVNTVAALWLLIVRGS